MTDREKVLRVCDEVVGERSVRDAEWPWLRDDAGQPFVVDAWWPRAQIAAVVAPDHELTTIARLQPLLLTLGAHGIQALPLWPELWRDGDLAIEQLRDDLRDPAGWQHLRAAWGLEGPPRYELVSGAYFDSDEDWDEDDSWAEDPDGDDEDFDVEESPLPLHMVELGWRTRPLLLALLGAATLVRRAERHVPDAILRDDMTPGVQLQILGLLGLHDADGRPSVSWSSIATALALDGYLLRSSLEMLGHAGHVEHSRDEYRSDEDQYAITPAGVAVLLDWLRRCGSLAAGWPPDHPEADDATGAASPL